MSSPLIKSIYRILRAICRYIASTLVILTYLDTLFYGDPVNIGLSFGLDCSAFITIDAKERHVSEAGGALKRKREGKRGDPRGRAPCC
jgi:hypothetical protein